MKKNKIFIIIISVILTMLFCVKSGEVNINYLFAEIIYGHSGKSSDIIFSKKSGFYSEEFELYIYAPTEEIYYTLDGSDPDNNSLKYQGSILIADASNNPNVYSMRTDVTTRISDKVDEEYINLSKKPLYVVPNEKIDKCTIIKAVYYDQYGNKSNVDESVYFVGFDKKEGYDNVNIISITTEPENLFDYEDGIYVTGERYDIYREEGIPEDKVKSWEHWNANYRQRGRKWERESYIQIFDKERKLVLSQTVGIRIQGGASRGFYPKSLNIYAREEYGEDRLNYDFWGTGYVPKRMTLSCSGNDYYTKIKDRLVSELSEECNIATMNYEPYILFLNGEYWGFYYLTEKYDAQYVEYYYGIDKGNDDENVIIIKNSKIEVGNDEDKNALYDKMVYFIRENDMSIDENYQRVCEMMDMESFIDYFAVESYIARGGDWPKSNFALWRSRNVSEKPYEDGKWRWMLFDVNSSSISQHLIDYDYIAENREDSELFDSLCENEEFKKRFSDRIMELTNTIFEKENVNQKITEYVQLMDKPMEKHYQRFLGMSNDLFHQGIGNIRSFFNERKPYIKETIINHFGEEYLGEN